MNCTSCGAPISSDEEKCSYCGTITPYGEKMNEARRKERLRQERQEHEAEELRRKAAQESDFKRQERLSRAKFKYVPVLFVIVFYALTGMLYGPYWYISRASSLNNLSESGGKKLSKWLCVFYAVLCVAVFMFPSQAEEYGISATDDASNYWVFALVFAVVLSVWLAFRTRTILNEYAGGFKNNIFGLPFDPFSILLFIAGPLYLQFEVNRMIKRGLLSPKI